MALAGGQESKIGLIEMKSRCEQDCVPLRGSGRGVWGQGSAFLPFPSPGDCLHSLAPGHITASSGSIVTSLLGLTFLYPLIIAL